MIRACKICSRNCVPTCPRGDSRNESTRAASPVLPETNLIARFLNSIGVPAIISDVITIPVLCAPAPLIPIKFFFKLPISMIFCAGIRARLSNPPAAVTNFAARLAPRRADKFGARPLIRDSKYKRTSRLQSFSENASSQPNKHCSKSSSSNKEPVDILKVTVIAMIT